MNTVTRVAEDLDSLGLNEEPEVEPETPPENTDEPTGVDDPADEPATTDREHTAKTAQALARAVDQLGVSFEQLMDAFTEVRETVHLFVEVIESQQPELSEMMDADGEEDGPADGLTYDPAADELGAGPDMIEDAGEGEEDDGDDAEIPQSE